MSISPGTRLGPYEILAPIGAGGMGEVYRARDPRLGRDVAIKILPAGFSADPDRLRRFEQEARAAAALNHPNILAVYDIGYERLAAGASEPASPYIVSELLEGSTLRDRLSAEALPVRKAVDYSVQTARGLAAAHDKGIVHRDLKPENIFVTTDGRVKILDFGLAKLKGDRSPYVNRQGDLSPSSAPTQTAHTTPGLVMGTVGYMSPEQVRGVASDHRADIFAFGAILYEMLAGQRAFHGETPAETMTAILKEHPPDLPVTARHIPPALGRIVERCLEKDPAARFKSADDLAFALEGLSAHSGATEAVVAPVPAPTTRLAFAGAGLLLIGALAAGLGVWKLKPETIAPPTRTLISVAPAEQLRANPADQARNEGWPSRTAIALSPDGRSLVLSAVRGGQQQLYLRRLDQLEATPMAGTEGGASPFFSPDGRWVGFWAPPGALDAPPRGAVKSPGALKKAALAGGPAITLCDTREIVGASWGTNGMIVFSRGNEGLQQVSASGGTPTPLTTLDAKQGEVGHRLPHLLPGGRAVLFTLLHRTWPRWDDDTQIVAQSLATGERTVLIEGGADPRYVSTGHLVYVRHGALLAVPFDPDRVAVTGSAVGLLDNVLQAANTLNSNIDDSGAAQVSVSDSGSLVYVPGGTYPAPERRLVWVDRAGAVQPLGAPPRPYFLPRLAPNGQRLLVVVEGDYNIWLYDLSGGTLTRWVTTGQNHSPLWSPDGTRAAFSSATAGNENLFWRRVDGSEAAERLTTSAYVNRPSSWSPDGQTLAFIENHPTTRRDIWVLSLAGDRRPHPVLQTRFDERQPAFSPDAQWLAYTSDESGRDEVYVQPYPGPGVRQQVSTEGGDSPAWSRDGRELFYVALPAPGSSTVGEPVRKMMAVPVTTHQVFTAGAPKMLFEGAYAYSTPIRGYDVTPDGRRFLMVQPKDRPPLKPNQMILVQNWLEELKRRVPTK